MTAEVAGMFRVTRRTDDRAHRVLCAAMFLLAALSLGLTLLLADALWPSVVIASVFAVAGVCLLAHIIRPVVSELVVCEYHVRWGRVGGRQTYLHRTEVARVTLARKQPGVCTIRLKTGEAVPMPDELVAYEFELIARELSQRWPELPVTYEGRGSRS